MKHIPAQLSGGQQQRVAIARALAGTPRFLLADEPTGNLDSLMARQVVDLLEDINRRGTTIIMVTHDPELARRAHRNVHVMDGQVTDLQPFAAKPLVRPEAIAAGHDAGDTPCSPTTSVSRCKSLRRNPVLTALMIGAIALGVGVCITTLTVYRADVGQPDRASQRRALRGHARQLGSEPGLETTTTPSCRRMELTYRDAQALLRVGHPGSQGDHAQGRRSCSRRCRPSGVEAVPGRGAPHDQGLLRDVRRAVQVRRRLGRRRRTTARRWSSCCRRRRTRRPSAAPNSVGRTLRLDGRDFKVVGVLDDWAPTPKFYDLNNGAFDETEELFVPFSVGTQLEMQSAGNINCWRDQPINSLPGLPQQRLRVDPVLGRAARRASKVEAFQDFIDNYVREQKTLGRFERPLNNHLTHPDEWLKVNEVVQDDNRVLVGLSFMFLAVCLLNMIGLLLAKFLGAAPLVGLRRALGASKATIFRQHLVEVGVIGSAAACSASRSAALGCSACASCTRTTRADAARLHDGADCARHRRRCRA